MTFEDFATSFTVDMDKALAPAAGRFPPQMGDVWVRRDGGPELEFNGKQHQMCLGDVIYWSARKAGTDDDWGTEGFGGETFTNGYLTFVRLGPTTSVGSGSAAKATVEAYDKTTKRLLDMVAPAIVPDLKTLVAKPEARPAYVAPPVTFGASADSWSHAKPKPQRATYASLLAALEAEEGVVPPLKCQECGKLGARIGKRGKGMPDRQLCRECHIEADAQVLMLMKRPMFYQAPAETAAEPYQPSCDPDFDIPYSWELP